MLNRLKVQKTEEQTLNNHKQVILHTIMIVFLTSLGRHVFVCLFSPEVQKILQYLLERTFFTYLNKKKHNKLCLDSSGYSV